MGLSSAASLFDSGASPGEEGAADAAEPGRTPPAMAAGDLNPAQREAVEHRDGPLIVLAGPGTGKTRVIVHRVERIIRDGADPRGVAAITFTNRAAAELRERLAASIGASAADRMYAGTIHGFGDMLIRRLGDLINLPARHVLLDSARRRRLMRAIVLENDLYRTMIPLGRETVLDDAARVIESLQNWCVFPARAERFAAEWAERVGRNADGLDDEALAAERARAARFAGHARLYALLDAKCREKGWYGYGDMVLLAVRVLDESELAAAQARDLFRHVVVDEFQDVDRGQIELLKLLCPAKHSPDLCVVGDDDQSIYGFRGADDRAFAHFAAIWPEHRTVKLEWNYRSEGAIVAAANAIMSRADVRFAPGKVVALPPEKRSAPPAPGAAVEVVEYPQLDDEGEAVAALILADRRRNPDRAWSSYAVIGRTYSDLERVAGALAVEGIPARVSRGASILDDRGVRDLMRWIELLSEPAAVYAALWLLSRPPFDVPMEATTDWARRYRAEASRHAAGEDGRADPGTFLAWLGAREGADAGVQRFLRTHAELLDAAGRLPAYEASLRVIRAGQVAHAELLPAAERAARIGRLAEVLRFVRDRGPLLDPPGDLRALWAYYKDMSDEDWSFRDETDRFAEATPGEDKPDEVTILTGHKAKGLEFDTVFVLRAWPQYGFPSTKSRSEEDLPEGLVDRAGDTRDAEARSRAEERRLFYVACTRAERRLVILTKAQKKRSDTLHFVHEMLRDGTPPPGIVVRTAAEVYRAAREAGVDLSGQSRLGGEGPTVADRRAVIEQERTRSRRSAAEALDSIDRPGVTGAELDAAAARLRAAGARLALAAQLGESPTPPAWHGAEGLSADAEGIAARLAKGGGGTGPVLRALKPPLKLSFTKIWAYERCPRCFYLEHVYRVREGAPPGMVLGSVVHTTLEKFYRAWLVAEADGKPTPGLKDLLEMGRREFFRALAPGQEAPPDLRQRLEGQLALAFERLHNASDEIEEIELSIRFPYEHAGVAHEFEAKLDRLDRLPPPGGHLIIDYKTGKATDAKRAPEGDDLQLGIYALALRHHQGIALDDRTTPAVGAAEYWLLATGERGRIDLKDIKYDKIRGQIGRAIEGMLSGAFPRGTQCSGLCDILGPEWTDPRPPSLTP